MSGRDERAYVLETVSTRLVEGFCRTFEVWREWKA